MPNKEFLEQYPLYRKFQQAFPQTIDQFPIVKIKMLCPECISEQTFRPTNKYFENFGSSRIAVGFFTRFLKIIFQRTPVFSVSRAAQLAQRSVANP